MDKVHMYTHIPLLHSLRQEDHKLNPVWAIRETVSNTKIKQKYLDINFTKEIQNLYTQNYRTLPNKIKDNIGI